MAEPPMAALEGLVRELLREEAPLRIAALTEELFLAARSLPEEAGGAAQGEPPAPGPPEGAGGACASPPAGLAQVEEAAVSLWNWAVAKHTGAVVSDEQKAKLRFVACRLIRLCEGPDPAEGTIRRQILMSMKTGKGWIDVGKADLADGFLENAMSNIEKLYAKLRKGSDGEADIQEHRADVENNLFKVLSYQAESVCVPHSFPYKSREAVAQGDFQKAMVCVQRCKDIVMKLPKETCYLSILCYNFGVETYECKRYEESSFWLSQSYDIGKMDMKYSIGKEMQAKVLRLLATTYFEWDCTLHLDRALKAINLANQENTHPAGFFLKVKILLKSGASDEDIKAALAEFLHLEMSLDFCLNTAKLLLEHGRESVGLDFLKSVPERFESSPDLGKITLLHIEFLLQNKRELLAKQKIEEIIIGHYTGKQLLPETLNQLHIILWDRAAKHYEEKSYSEALHWYNYSVSFYTPRQIDQNLAKLQRNMASCYFHLKQVDKAKEAVREAERCDPNSIFTKFSVYKIAVMENDTNKAVEAVVEMGKLAEKTSQREDKLGVDKNTGTNLLSLAAQIALENDQQSVAIKALEYLSEHLQDYQQLFAALKCLVRLLLSKVMAEKEEKRDEDIDSILNYLNLGDFAKDPTDTLLLLYEFEARSKLNDPSLHNFMESVWEQPQIETKTLEIIASLAMESPARYPVLCKKALRSALNLHRKQTVIDAVKFSKCLHSLINISLPSGLTDLETSVLQEVWDYFEDALSVVSSTNAYPEMEILWLMTRAWNTGIFQYTVGKYKEAEQWCGLGMRFLNHLGSLKKSYEGHLNDPALSILADSCGAYILQMIGLYSEVLDKLDRAKGFIPSEE
ncbi:testis-expressed sequence 11 protein [Pitangus sulphuratus]|nr:testis-expressed sequence 11 protein [Pitangus sulphuratus]